jgi:hypothetical protein
LARAVVVEIAAALTIVAVFVLVVALLLHVVVVVFETKDGTRTARLAQVRWTMLYECGS